MATRKDLTNAIRALAMDAVQKANSGHPGMPMGMAEIAEVLWNHHLRHNPANPHWADRDRFVLSNGHGSMLLYALLHLTGYDLPMEELKRFRQLHSKTPGHPEYGITPGVETTTGPLGQGIANAVGMAHRRALLAAEFNRPGYEIVNHHTYVFVGDGCLMEGISHEACSLAGTLGSGQADRLLRRQRHLDRRPRRGLVHRRHAEALRGLRLARRAATWTVTTSRRSRRRCWRRRRSHRPAELICCKTVIGKGSPNKAGTHEAHGAALGDDEVAATREHIGWEHPPFEIPADVYAGWDARAKGADLEAAWNKRFAEYERAHPGARRPNSSAACSGELPANWQDVTARVRRQDQRERRDRSPPARPRRTRSRRWRRRCPSSSAVRPTWPAPTSRYWSGSQRDAPGAAPATTSTTACASSACPRS